MRWYQMRRREWMPPMLMTRVAVALAADVLLTLPCLFRCFLPVADAAAAFSDAAAVVADAPASLALEAACVSDVRGGFDAPARC